MGQDLGAIVVGVGSSGTLTGLTRFFRVADPEVAALMLLGGVRAVIRFGTRPHPRDLARRLVRTILFGAAGGRD